RARVARARLPHPALPPRPAPRRHRRAPGGTPPPRRRHNRGASRRERLGRDPRGRVGYTLLAPIDAAAPEAAPTAGRRSAAAGPGGRATGRARARRAGPDSHGALPRGPGRRRGTADPAAPDPRRAAGGVYRSSAGVGGAVDLATRPWSTNAVATRRLGGRRCPRVPARRP